MILFFSRTACAQGDAGRAIVQLLLDRGADVNQQDENKNTALMFAVANCDRQTIRLLLKAGAKLDHRNGTGLNALEMGIVSGNPGLEEPNQAGAAPRPPENQSGGGPQKKHPGPPPPTKKKHPKKKPPGRGSPTPPAPPGPPPSTRAGPPPKRETPPLPTLASPSFGEGVNPFSLPPRHLVRGGGALPPAPSPLPLAGAPAAPPLLRGHRGGFWVRPLNPRSRPSGSA